MSEVPLYKTFFEHEIAHGEQQCAVSFALFYKAGCPLAYAHWPSHCPLAYAHSTRASPQSPYGLPIPPFGNR